MKYFAVTVLGAIFAFLLADFMLAQPSSPQSTSLQASLSDAGGNTTAIAFKHALHGDSIGLDCAHCHTGAKTAAHAYMPSKSDCIDCHRLPLTENPGIEILEVALKNAPSQPWVKKSMLPDHVQFHHGVHTVAGVSCDECHGNYKSDSYGGEKFDMRTCLACHRGETDASRNFKRAATYCAACHR